MVDKELIFLDKNEKYGIIKLQHDYNQVVFCDGQRLRYGDPAELFSAITEEEFILFVETAIASGHYIKEHYGFVFGYQPADFDNDEIKENEVKIQYADVVNIISKTAFYKLCLLLCNAKLNMRNEQQRYEELRLLKSKLENSLNQP